MDTVIPTSQIPNPKSRRQGANLRIVHYNLTTTSIEGGVETFVWELSQEQARRGHAVTIIGGAGQVQRAVAGVRVLRYPYIGRAAWRSLRPLRRHFELTKLLERLSMLPAALPALLGAQADIVHLHKPYDFVIAPLMSKLGAHVVYHGHGEDFYPFDRQLTGSIDEMLSCSSYNAETLKRRYGRDPTVVYNGFDAAHFVPQPVDQVLRRSLLAPDERAVLMVGRLQPWKGVQYGIEALALLAPALRTRLLIGGESPYRPQLEQLVRDRGVEDQVTFLGTIPHREMPRYYALADVVVGASFASETFGMVLCEAQGCARPVIASDWAGFREVVIHEETGLVVPAQNPPALAAAIERVFRDPANAKRMGEAGRERVLRLFTWPAITDRVEQAYRHVLDHGTSPA
jgi:glycosyltransferase involved in cell wall biosynthesis